MLTIKNKKKLFTRFLPILLCLMLLAGAASPAVPSQTYAQGEDDLIISPVPAVDFAADTSLDSPDSLLESVPENAAEQMAEGNTVYDEETPAESASEDDVTEGIDDTEPGTLTPPTLIADSTDNTVGNPIELTFTDDEGWRNAVKEVTVNDSAIASDDYTLAADKLTIDASVFTDPGEYTIVIKADGYEDATVTQILTTSDFVVQDGVLVEYKGAGGDVVIPGDLGITTIGSMVFAYLNNLTSVVVPEGVTTIGGIAFEGCSNLTTVVLPESVNKIGAFAFAECPKLTQINIPEAVTCIEQETFYRCYALTSIRLPSGITSIEEAAFQQCYNLSEVNIPDAVTSIGKNAFRRCEALTEIVIPANVISIGDSAFSRCANLTSLTIHSTETAFGSGVFAECPKLTIYGYSGSTAEAYANENSIPFVAIVTSVDIQECDQQELKVGQTLQLTVIVEPEGAMYKSIIWSSSNEAVATVDEAGLVTAIAEGTATITVTITAVNGSFTDDITIKVVPGVVVLEGETTPEGDIRLKFNKAIDNLAEGAENQFTVHVDGEIITVTDAISNETNDEIILVLETKITVGQEISVDYTKSADETKWIKSKDNEVLDNFLALNINNHFLLPAPVLKADDTDNKVGEPIDLTFEDDPVWRAAITEVILDGTPLQKEQYTVSEGKITIAASVFTSAKTYNIIVKADRYSEAAVVQTIKEGEAGPGLEDPPELTADTTNNVVGQPIELTFSDDSSWRNSISDITVNGASIALNKYSVSAGIITIDAGVFTTAGSYTVVIKAGGYKNATVTQEIFALTVTGPGVNTTRMFTQTQIESLPQIQEVYSCINTWPSKKWYVGKGVSLKTLLTEAGGIKPEATLIKFSSSDGYTRTLTVQELLKDRRYRFPNFKEGGGDADGHIPGDPSGAFEVETILGLVSAEGTDDPSYMNDANTPLLMLGQRAVTEQTGPSFVKYVNKIEVITGSVPKWDEPTASVPPGEVPAGTKVELHSRGDDEDKVYYTLDGSIPDLNSPMYNWIAKRWWPSRGEETVAEINRPIELTKDTTIKAITIGPGKENSAVVTFEYKVIPAKPSESSEEIEPSEGGTVNLDDEAIIEIPAGALTGTEKMKIKIERVGTPPAAPSGFKLLSDVFEFTIGGKKNYTFNKIVTITLSFDPKAVGKGETPSIHRYDEDLRQWINLGGEISNKDNTISVEVDHFSKFAVMAALPSSVTATIKPGEGGTVSLGDEAAIEIPAGALSGSKAVEVKIERVKRRLLRRGLSCGRYLEFSIDSEELQLLRVTIL